MSNSLEMLVIRMAENRAEHRAVVREIKGFGDKLWCSEDLDMSVYRDEWYGVDEYGSATGPHWMGWVAAVKNFDGEVPDCARQLAVLLDKKRQLRQELGWIRRSLCAVGRGMLKKQAREGEAAA